MQTTRVDFTNDQGEQYVDMRVFKSVPWGLSKRLNTVGDMNTDEAKLKVAERVSIELVVGGRVLNAWTGEEMAFPLTDETIGDAPAEMLLAVLAKFSEMKSEVAAEQKKL